MLYFTADELRPIKDKREMCFCCGERFATWAGNVTDSLDDGFFCAHCVMYDSSSQWGRNNRDELLRVGHSVQGVAISGRKEPPKLDERLRLAPDDAEQYMMGVAFTNGVLGKMGFDVSH